MSKVVKVFISQPMRDKTEEEIKQERERAIKNIETLIVDDAEVEIIDSILPSNTSFSNSCLLVILYIILLLSLLQQFHYYLQIYKSYQASS